MTGGWRPLPVVTGRSRRALVTVLLGALAVWLVGRELAGSGFIDLAVYERAARSLLSGESLYAVRPELPFTYPPFAAAVFTPLLLLPSPVTVVAVAVTSLAGLTLTLRAAWRHTGMASSWLPAAVLAAALTEPVLRTLHLGQVNLVLMAMVSLDLLATRRPATGLLTGVAIGIKLTPAVFLLALAVRRRWADLGRAVLAWALTVVIGVAVAPTDSRDFWATLLWDSSRVGGTGYVDNQSILGALTRLGSGPPSTLWVGAVSLAALVLAGAAGWRHRACDLVVLAAAALGGLCVSPISWSHHWVWLAPAAVALVHLRHWAWAVLTAAVAVVGPHWLVPHDSAGLVGPTPWAQAAAAAFPVLAACLLAVLAGTPGGLAPHRRDGKHCGT